MNPFPIDGKILAIPLGNIYDKINSPFHGNAHLHGISMLLPYYTLLYKS